MALHVGVNLYTGLAYSTKAFLWQLAAMTTIVNKGRQADRQTGRQTGRQAGRQTGRQTGRPGQ